MKKFLIKILTKFLNAICALLDILTKEEAA